MALDTCGAGPEIPVEDPGVTINNGKLQLSASPIETCIALPFTRRNDGAAEFLDMLEAWPPTERTARRLR
jgi:hypothetical protein